MSFPFLRTVPPPPPANELQAQHSPQPFFFPPPQCFGPSRQNHNNGRGNSRGNGRGRGWSRKLPTTPSNNVQKNFIAKDKKNACDTCDRSFGSDMELSEHMAQHETCGREGCTFSAHPKVVAKHIEFQHNTGLYARIKKEAAQWIEERKKKFPTQANLDRQKLEMDEKIARGERIHEPNNRFGSRGRGGWRKEGRNQHHPYRKQPQNRAVSPTQELSQPIPIPPAVPECLMKGIETAAPAKANPLVSLLGQYCSGDSDSDSPPEETSVSRVISGPPIPLPVPQVEKKVVPKREVHRPIRQPVNPRESFRRRNRPPTLLQQLLEPEIRRERNILLQCVRYVVQKNFLQ